MRILIKNGVFISHTDTEKDLALDLNRAHSIARANGYANIEKMGIHFNGMVLLISDTTNKILKTFVEAN